MKKAIYHFCLFASGLMLLSCNRDPETMEGPTIGKQQIMADENLRYIIQQEEEVFENAYKYAQVEISYAAEQDIVQALLDDSIDAVIASRRLTPEELKFLDSKQQHPREFEMATSAIAFIRQLQSVDTVIVYEVLLNQMRDAGSGVVFVLEDAKSGIATMLLDVLDLEKLPAHFYALNTKAEVLSYIDQHAEAIGIIDYSEISDSDSAYAKDVLKRIQLVGITRPVDSLQMGYVRPFQYNLQDDKYPFTRDLYFISNSGKSDVGIGFITFICGEIGQKIILKAGLLPTYQTERIIEINPSTDIKVVR